MSNVRINAIGREQGRAAALAYAVVSMAPYKIRKAIEDGTYNFGHSAKAAKSEPKIVIPTLRETRTIVDRIGDKRLVKVVLGRDFVGYQLEVMGESGEVVSTEGLSKLSLVEARALIGKSISHPTPANAGKPTNDPTVSRNMKGSNGGGGDNKKGKKGK